MFCVGIKLFKVFKTNLYNVNIFPGLGAGHQIP